MEALTEVLLGLSKVRTLRLSGPCSHFVIEVLLDYHRKEVEVEMEMEAEELDTQVILPALRALTLHDLVFKEMSNSITF